MLKLQDNRYCCLRFYDTTFLLSQLSSSCSEDDHFFSSARPHNYVERFAVILVTVQATIENVSLSKPSQLPRRFVVAAYLRLKTCMYNVYADDDHCISNPCTNDAECRPLSGGFTCSPCPLNVTGARCEFGTWTNKQKIHFISIQAQHQKIMDCLFSRHQHSVHIFYLLQNSRPLVCIGPTHSVLKPYGIPLRLMR